MINLEGVTVWSRLVAVTSYCLDIGRHVLPRPLRPVQYGGALTDTPPSKLTFVVSVANPTHQASDVFDRHLHTRELQGVFSSLAEMFFQVRCLSRCRCRRSHCRHRRRC